MQLNGGRKGAQQGRQARHILSAQVEPRGTNEQPHLHPEEPNLAHRAQPAHTSHHGWVQPKTQNPYPSSAQLAGLFVLGWMQVELLLLACFLFGSGGLGLRPAYPALLLLPLAFIPLMTHYHQVPLCDDSPGIYGWTGALLQIPDWASYELM